jgi:hypothetical protein
MEEDEVTIEVIELRKRKRLEARPKRPLLMTIDGKCLGVRSRKSKSNCPPQMIDCVMHVIIIVAQSSKPFASVLCCYCCCL